MGATHLLDPSTAHKSAIPNGSLRWHYGEATNQTDFGDAAHGAFGHVTVNSTEMIISHVSSEGKLLYTAPALRPRTC